MCNAVCTFTLVGLCNKLTNFGSSLFSCVYFRACLFVGLINHNCLITFQTSHHNYNLAFCYSTENMQAYILQWTLSIFS